MKRGIRSEKGFSLIELLIVIAIMGVLAVVALTSFGSVLGNSRKNADIAVAKNIEKQITLAMVELDVTNPKKLNIGGTDIANDQMMIIWLQGRHLIDGKYYGPYLENPDVTTSPVFETYEPQWNSARGGDFTGYDIKYNEDTGDVRVEPTNVAGPVVITEI
jgi:type IV pilus assembly protein PilA